MLLKRPTPLEVRITAKMASLIIPLDVPECHLVLFEHVSGDVQQKGKPNLKEVGNV